MYTKLAGLAGHVHQIFKMSGKELLLNSIKCPLKHSKCPGEAQKVFAYTGLALSKIPEGEKTLKMKNMKKRKEK